MGRELQRVPLDFNWPLKQPWQGYLNPHYTASDCPHCDGTGLSPEAKRLKDLWYGYAPFKPEDRGSVPFTPATPEVRAFAERNVKHAPDFYGQGEAAIQCEAERLCRLWNGCWSHHLNADDVAALVAAGRLMDLTHTWSRKTGWQPKDPPHVPTPAEVNVWSISGMGHDAINQWAVSEAVCRRLGAPESCAHCEGEGHVWPSPEDKARYEAWESYDPPEGEGYQMWETTSEGSPISPVFATPEELARWLAGNRKGTVDEGTSFETWLAFIQGPGWAPSVVSSSAGVQTGVQAVVDQDRGSVT